MSKKNYSNKFEDLESRKIAFMKFSGVTKIHKEKLFIQAITCKDFANKYFNETGKELPNNESLAIIGDAVITASLTHLRIKENKKIFKGTVTELNQKIENNDYLSKKGFEHQIIDFLFTTPEGYKKRGVATAYEAVIAYIFLAYGFNKVTRLIKQRLIN